MSLRLTIAVPKGRLLEPTQDLFHRGGLRIEFRSRELIATNREAGVSAILVKNTDLPTYVSHGITGMGICGGDLIYESGAQFLKLLTLPFGKTKMCIACKAGYTSGKTAIPDSGYIRVATKFTRFAIDYFHRRGIPVQIIKLNGSVELAPLLGLAPYIMDLVETGNTLRENNLEVIDELETMHVHLIANPAYYKIHYRKIDELVDTIRKVINS